MQAILMGDIADSLTETVCQALPYVEKDILQAIVKEVLPQRGIVIEATKEELEGNKALGGLLYHEVEIKRRQES